MITVDLAILPMPQTIDGIGHVLRHTGRAVGSIHKFAWERLPMALSRREIVVVVIKGDVKSFIICGNTGDVVEGTE